MCPQFTIVWKPRQIVGLEDKSGMVLTIAVVDIHGNMCIQTHTYVDNAYVCAHTYVYL